MTCRVTQDALLSYVQFAERGRVIVFDTETTGISNADEIIQLAAAEYVCGKLERYRLGYHIEALGIPGKNSHNALDDTLACGELFFDLVRRVPICADDYIYEPVFE